MVILFREKTALGMSNLNGDSICMNFPKRTASSESFSRGKRSRVIHHHQKKTLRDEVLPCPLEIQVMTHGYTMLYGDTAGGFRYISATSELKDGMMMQPFGDDGWRGWFMKKLA